MELAGSLYKKDGGIISLTEGGENYIKQELGITLQQKRNRQMIAGITDPATFIAARTTKQDADVKKNSLKFAEVHDKLMEAGVPKDEAREEALRYVKRLQKADDALLELEYPTVASNLGIQGLTGGVVQKRRRAKK